MRSKVHRMLGKVLRTPVGDYERLRDELDEYLLENVL
jgi:hypothetical protein